MSAARVCGARSRVPVWHSVTVAFSLSPGEQQPERASDRDAATDDRHLGAGDRYVVPAQQLDDAARRARQRRRDAEHEAAEVHRVQPVRVLVGIDELERTRRVESRGSGSWTM